MGLSNKMVWTIVTLMVIALAGLVGLQASLLSDAMASTEASFRQNVLASMSAVAEQLEAAETTFATLHVVGTGGTVMVAAEKCVEELNLADSTDGAADTYRRIETEVFLRSESDSGVFRTLDTVIVPRSSLSNHELAIETFGLSSSHPAQDSAMIIIQYSTDSAGHEPQLPGFLGMDTIGLLHGSDSSRVQMISRVMRRLASQELEPILDRIDSTLLDSLIRSSLAELGVDLPSVYGIVLDDNDSLVYQHPDGYAADLRRTEFRAGLFSTDFLGSGHSLALFFPDRDAYVLKQIGPMIAAIALFMLVIVLGFGFSIRTIVAQRRTARLMVDFVNNMTHEFKTPISTVALACEAIMREDVAGDREKVARFSRMIRDENRRMRHQTEKILQMAALEEKQGRLKQTEVDVHEVIRSAVESIALQIETREGQIKCDLAASDPRVMADEVHLTGIIYNLLDNANKYSPEKPTIAVRTVDCPDGIKISVEDRGIGLRPEDHKRIFQKYHRVSQGNVHDVKGFGLGLSYVNLMVEAHGGRINVESKPGQGTRINLWLPRLDDNSSPKGA